MFSQLQRPDVDAIDGLPPTLCVAQQAGSAQRRSTLATITEIHDHLRLLWARLGIPHCLNCHEPVIRHSIREIVRQTLALEEGHKIYVMAPLVRDQAGPQREAFQTIRQAGFLRARIDGVLEEIRGVPELKPKTKHTIEMVVDRLVVKSGIEDRLTESLGTAVKHANGHVVVTQIDDGDWHDHYYSTKLACPRCGATFPDLEPRQFSFNNPDAPVPPATDWDRFSPMVPTSLPSRQQMRTTRRRRWLSSYHAQIAAVPGYGAKFEPSCLRARVYMKSRRSQWMTRLAFLRRIVVLTLRVRKGAAL